MTDQPERFNGISVRMTETLPEEDGPLFVDWGLVKQRLSFWARLRVRFEAAREAWDDAL